MDDEKRRGRPPVYAARLLTLPPGGRIYFPPGSSKQNAYKTVSRLREMFPHMALTVTRDAEGDYHLVRGEEE